MSRRVRSGPARQLNLLSVMYVAKLQYLQYSFSLGIFENKILIIFQQKFNNALGIASAIDWTNPRAFIYAIERVLNIGTDGYRDVCTARQVECQLICINLTVLADVRGMSGTSVRRVH